jgi:hypothetical protein
LGQQAQKKVKKNTKRQAGSTKVLKTTHKPKPGKAGGAANVANSEDLA